MTEEKKEEAKAVPVQANIESPKTEPQQETAQAPAVKKEKPSNCGSCKKSIKKKRWYYRNGMYFCSKRCWEATLKKEEKTNSPAAEAK